MKTVARRGLPLGIHLMRVKSSLQDAFMFRRNATVSEAMQISTDRLKETPFFGPFADNSICTSNAISGIYTPLLAQLLADAIPAESLPAGYTNVPAWESDQCENNELSCVKYRDEIMKGVLQNYEWKHSFFISVPYSVSSQKAFPK